MKEIACEQRSPEWYAYRRGMPTASNFGLILTPTGVAARQRDAYLYRLAAERVLNGEIEEQTTSFWMARGAELEAEARAALELIVNAEIRCPGFCCDDACLYGCSPDGIIAESIGVEIKCPKATTHIQTLISGQVPTEHIPQIQGGMLVTGYSEWIFMSYYPGLKPFVCKVERDELYISKLRDEIARFVEDLYAIVKKIR